MGWIQTYIIYKYRGVCYNEQCYNERMLKRTVLSIKSGRHNERGGTIFITEISIIDFTKERYFMFIRFIRESLFIVFTEERLFMLFKFTCTNFNKLIYIIFTLIFLNLYYIFPV